MPVKYYHIASLFSIAFGASPILDSPFLFRYDIRRLGKARSATEKSKEDRNMDQKLIESLKGKSREERAAFFKEHRMELLSPDDLKIVNGGTGENPNSSVPYDGNWYTSFGFVCEGRRQC